MANLHPPGVYRQGFSCAEISSHETDFAFWRTLGEDLAKPFSRSFPGPLVSKEVDSFKK